eukprot:EG_transcript_45370
MFDGHRRFDMQVAQAVGTTAQRLSRELGEGEGGRERPKDELSKPYKVDSSQEMRYPTAPRQFGLPDSATVLIPAPSRIGKWSRTPDEWSAYDDDGVAICTQNPVQIGPGRATVIFPGQASNKVVAPQLQFQDLIDKSHPK